MEGGTALNPALDLKKTARVRAAAENMAECRIPPNSPESEQAVLGAILLCPKENLSECQELFESDEVFYDLKNREIYRAMIWMSENLRPLDFMTLQQRLKDVNMLEQVGGFSYLAALPDRAGTAGYLGTYAHTLVEKHTLRKLLRTCTDIASRVLSNEEEVASLLDEAEIDVLKIRDSRANESKSSKALVAESLVKLEMLFEKQGAISGLSTGLRDLDKLTDGMHGGEMIVIAAFPSTGKTAITLNIIVKNALAGVPCAVFSAEMRPVQLMIRSICAESRINLYDFRDGNATALEFQRMTSASAKLASAPIYIENANGWSIAQLQASARRLRQQHGIRLIAVDYIQLLSAKADGREQEISKISKGLKSIAMELDCPVIALSQLNDDGKLRESRSIGQDADSVWKLELDGDWKPDVQPIKLKVDKNREGATGEIKVMFLKKFTRFEDAAQIDEKDVPNGKQRHKND